jgi:hypothetical protein
MDQGSHEVKEVMDSPVRCRARKTKHSRYATNHNPQGGWPSHSGPYNWRMQSDDQTENNSALSVGSWKSKSIY